jgi:hypothetical protein
MNLPVSVSPGMPENIGKSRDLGLRENPVNEEHDRQVGGNELVLEDNAQVQVIRHNFSFFWG